MGWSSGYLRLGKWGGIPFSVHWSALIGALIFSGMRFIPGVWLGYFLIILLHECGHAVMVRLFRLQVVAIEVSGLGGLCHWRGHASGWQRSVIAWGGVLAQALLYCVTMFVVETIAFPRAPLVSQLVQVFTSANLYIIAINLIPFPPLDGAQAWRIFGYIPLLWSRRRRSVRPSRYLRPVEGDEEDGTLSPELRAELERLAEEAKDEAGRKRKILH